MNFTNDYQCLKTGERNADCDIIDATLDILAVISTDGDITKEGTTDSFSMPSLIVTLWILLCIAVCAYLFSVSSNAKHVQNEVSRNSLPEKKDEVQTDEQTEKIMKWKKTHVHFEETTASKIILDEMKTNGFVILSGPPGCGKSTIAYNTAFILEETAKFKILPISSPEEIRKYLSPETKQIFVFDDPVGRYAVDDTSIRRWKNEENFIKETFTNSWNTKLILTCRSYIHKSGFSRLLHVSPIHFDLLSSDLKLSIGERTKLCKRYNLPDLNEDTIMMYDFFPLLCAEYSPLEDTNMFFVNPYKILIEEIGNIKEKSDIAYLAIALLVVQDDNFGKQSLSLENQTIKELLNDLCNECGFKYFPSTTVLLAALYDLIGTYIKETEHGFACIHDTLFQNLSFIVGSSIIHCLLKYGNCTFIANRLQLASIQQEHDELVIMVKPEQEEYYFQRLLIDIGKGYQSHVFTGIQMKYSAFRSKLLTFLKLLKAEEITCDEYDSTPLHVVSEQGYDDFLYLLYHLKQDQINHQNTYKRTPLFMACLGGHDKVIQIILCLNNSSMNVTNDENLTPLDVASINDDLSTLTVLLKYDAKVNRKDKKIQRTALQRACDNGSYNAVKFLLTKNADVKLKDVYGLKAIHIACSKGHLKIVKLLLKHDETMINERDCDGRTPLFISCENNQENISCMLLNNKANVNQTNVKGASPLYKACKIGNENIVGLLLYHSAKMNIQSEKGLTPLHIACVTGNVKIVEMLLQRKAEVNISSKQGWTPFLISCSKGCLEICNLLLARGVNINTVDKSLSTSLHVACRGKQEHIVRFLINHSANINAVNTKKETPLYIACLKECYELVEFLIINRADVNICEEEGNSPLHAVCVKGNKRIVELLLDKKADIHKRNKKGNTPCDVVQHVQGEEDDVIVEMISRYKAK